MEYIWWNVLSVIHVTHARRPTNWKRKITSVLPTGFFYTVNVELLERWHFKKNGSLQQPEVRNMHCNALHIAFKPEFVWCNDRFPSWEKRVIICIAEFWCRETIKFNCRRGGRVNRWDNAVALEKETARKKSDKMEMHLQTGTTLSDWRGTKSQ